MPTHTSHCTRSPAGDITESPAITSYEITPELVDRYVYLGRQLRAKEIARLSKQFADWVHSLFGRSARAEKAGETYSGLAGGLTSP